MIKNPVIPIWKPVGSTPLKTIRDLQNKYPEYKDEKISYAGRLDPMAEGVLLLLVGDENKKRKEYEKLSKVYESEIFLGITTDSFDALGIINSVKPENHPSKDAIKNCLRNFIGKQKQLYPPYSSKTVRGKPLFWWAREDKISEIKIPAKQIEIYSINILSLNLISAHTIYKGAVVKIKKIEGKFRQEMILNSWDRFLKENQENKFLKIKLNISCSSGTYVRRLASDIGVHLKCGGFALSIIRASVGKYSASATINIE